VVEVGAVNALLNIGEKDMDLIHRIVYTPANYTLFLAVVLTFYQIRPATINL